VPKIDCQNPINQEMVKIEKKVTEFQAECTQLYEKLNFSELEFTHSHKEPEEDRLRKKKQAAAVTLRVALFLKSTGKSLIDQLERLKAFESLRGSNPPNLEKINILKERIPDLFLPVCNKGDELQRQLVPPQTWNDWASNSQPVKTFKQLITAQPEEGSPALAEIERIEKEVEQFEGECSELGRDLKSSGESLSDPKKWSHEELLNIKKMALILVIQGNLLLRPKENCLIEQLTCLEAFKILKEPSLEKTRDLRQRISAFTSHTRDMRNDVRRLVAPATTYIERFFTGYSTQDFTNLFLESVNQTEDKPRSPLKKQETLFPSTPFDKYYPTKSVSNISQ
jgi:hypothetical protein